MRKYCLLLIVFVTASCVAWAQDSTRVTMLEEVVVSSSRTETPVIEAPRSVTVIGREKIHHSIYHSVGELLNAESGLFVVGANQTPGTNQNIFMRGANSNQVAVLVDGVRITDPSSPNAAIDFSEISLTNVERIEVIRGSHSTLFGGAAVGGVINIITKKGARPGFSGHASWQGGALGDDAWSSAESIDLAFGDAGGFYARGSLFRQDVKGLDASEGSPSSFTADQDDFRKTDGLLSAGFQNEKWHVNASYKKVHQYTEIDDGAYADDENSYLEFDRHLLQYSATHQYSPSLEAMILGSFSQSERFFKDDSSRVSESVWDHTFSTGTYYGRLQTHELQLTYKGGHVRGIFGMGMYREKMFFDSYLLYNDPMFPYESTTNYDSLDTRTTTGYVFARAGYKRNRFDLSAGARLSRHTETGTFATFEVSPSYSFNHLMVYGSLSSGFNPPSLYQLYDPVRSAGSFATRGNRMLEPERSLSVELGIKKAFTSGSYLTLSAYRTQVKNSIEYVYLWNRDKAVSDLDFSDFRGDRYLNVAEQDVGGVELEGMVYLSAKFSLMANISWLEAKVGADPDDTDPAHTGGHHVQLYNLGRFLDNTFDTRDVIRRPRFTAFSKLTWHASNAWRFEVNYRFTGNRHDAFYDEMLGPYGALSLGEVDAYHLVDLAVHWRVTNPLSLACKVENILDEDYREVAGFRTRGRGVYLKANVRF